MQSTGTDPCRSAEQILTIFEGLLTGAVQEVIRRGSDKQAASPAVSRLRPIRVRGRRSGQSGHVSPVTVHASAAAELATVRR
jgi:hypothetical protein